MKISFMIREETVRLVASVVLGAETPVHIWKDWLFFEVYCAEDAAAYCGFPSTDVESREKRVYQLLVHFWLKSMVNFTRCE
jgi:hypothetical protein